MEFIKSDSIKAFSNPGVVSRQIINPENSLSERVTITEVYVEPGAHQPRHVHEMSEQIWYAIKGTGTLLLENGTERSFSCGDAVRFADGDVHGLRNDTEETLVYLSVTSPPAHFGYAYQNKE